MFGVPTGLVLLKLNATEYLSDSDLDKALMTRSRRCYMVQSTLSFRDSANKTQGFFLELDAWKLFKPFTGAELNFSLWFKIRVFSHNLRIAVRLVRQ